MAPGETAQSASRPVQRLPVRNAGGQVRQEVREALRKAGYQQNWHTIIDRIGSQTIRDDIGTGRLLTLLQRNGGDVDLVANFVNRASLNDINALYNAIGQTQLIGQIGALRPPVDLEIDRNYANYLRVLNAAGLIPWVPNRYANFRDQMLAGQHWDFAAGAFVPVSEAFRAAYAQAPTTAAAFCPAIYGGQNVNALGVLTPVPGWVMNPNTASQYELASAMQQVPIGGFARPFTDATRDSIAQVAGAPLGAQQLVAIGNAVPARMNQLLGAVEASAQPAAALAVINLVLAPGNAVADAGFPRALNHLDDLIAVRANLNPFSQNMPFGNRAGGLRGHFKKHPLGIQSPAYYASANWEASRWMAANRLGLAPNGLISRASLPGLANYSRDEWAIFQQHAGTYRQFWWWGRNVVPASMPTNAAEVQALVDYLRTPAGHGDADHLAGLYENAYQAFVANRFDNVGPNRFLYYDAGNLKANAYQGPLFMVAARNGNTFDLSTGYLIAGGRGRLLQ